MTIKKVGSLLLDICEIYIPAIAFLIMFSVFVLEIFCRYFFNYPLTWAYEVTVFGFIWTVILGAAYATRSGAHVMFDLLYEKQSPTGQRYMRMIGNAVLAIGFSLTIPASYQFIKFMAFEKSSVLKIPFHFGYAPYLAFLLIVVGRAVSNIAQDARAASKGA